MTARRIVGPQERFERTGERSLRDIRPLSTRLSEGLRGPGSGLVLIVGAGLCMIEPAVIHALVPIALLYALWVLSAGVALPLRLPRTARRRDPNWPDPRDRRPRMADGTLLLGWDMRGQELWVTSEDARQHIAIPGTTGAGKTTAILGLLANALAQGSGFVLVDGKADRDLFSKVSALARRFGREDDVRVLNFMVASGSRDSHTFNPFVIGNADAIRELLASQLADQAQNDANGVFRGRAVALMGTIAPVLVWLRDHRDVPLNIDVIRGSIELRWIWKLAMERRAEMRDAATGAMHEIDVSEMPVEILWPLRAYLGELPGYDPSVPLDKQKGEEPSKQHGYAQFYFTEAFTQLAVSLGHIFRVEAGDIDMRDIVLNRRILVVNLPALDNSDATLAGLGKLVVASLRGMMAQLLGASLEGDYSGQDKEGMGPTPFPVVLDELAYYATSGLDRMLAMGRGLNIAFILGFQEVSGIYARLGEKTASLLGNANLTIAMRQQDGGRTREWLEKTAGTTNVTQATTWHGNEDGMYREARHAEMRTVSRVDWNDLTSLIEGEAIVLLGGRRIYAKVFHAAIDDTGPKRLGRTLALAAPDPAALRNAEAGAARVVAALLEGRGAAIDERGGPPALRRLVEAFAGRAGRGEDSEGSAAAVLAAMSELAPEELPARPSASAEGIPSTAVTPMLADAAAGRVAAGADPGPPVDPVDAALLRGLEAIGGLAGEDGRSARDSALTLLADRDRALAVMVPVEPPAVESAELAGRLGAATAALAMIASARPAERRAA